MQKYKKGDHVKVAKDLGPSMSHFQNDCEAIVMGSYADQYGGSNTDSYTIHIKGSGETSWYNEHQLLLIEPDRIDLLEKWEKEREEEALTKSELNWIFSNGREVLSGAHGATIKSLAKCLGITNVWGSHGEGVVYYQNAMTVLSMAKPFLESGDKDGWLKYCQEYIEA